MIKKSLLKLLFFFLFVIFLIMGLLLIIFIIIVICIYVFLFINNRIFWLIINLYFISVIVGIVILVIIGKKVLNLFVKFSEVLMEVSKGNFDIKLDGNKYGVEEIELMICNFNVMVNEFNNIEIFCSDFIVNVFYEFKIFLVFIEGYLMFL